MTSEQCEICRVAQRVEVSEGHKRAPVSESSNGADLQGLREEDYADPGEMSTQIRRKTKTVFQSPTKLISIFV